MRGIFTDLFCTDLDVAGSNGFVHCPRSFFHRPYYCNHEFAPHFFRFGKILPSAVIAKAQEEREKGAQVLVTRMNKNKKFQKEQLSGDGYTEFAEFYKNPLKQ